MTDRTSPATIVEPQRIDELRSILERIDPAKRKAWVLEVYEVKDGKQVLAGALDIKTGKPVSKARSQGRPGE